ncbi:MAG: 1-acyl-sn-glycerol-3-phosphate acyltransferase [Cryomorphaceae bacterium]
MNKVDKAYFPLSNPILNFMIYRILKPLVTVSLQAYFKRISVQGRRNLDHKHLLLVSNHPSAMFDPLLVAVTSKKQLHFIAGVEWFGSGLKKWLFTEHFNMIPVYRPWLKTGENQDNSDMFRACYDSLAAGHSIIIYPEAESITVPWIRELKTGAARIKMGADVHFQEQGIEEDVKVVPIGLNYSNPHRFQSGLLINVGEPIDFSGIDRSGDPKEVARAMTDRIKSGMQDQVLHIEEEGQYPLIKATMKLLTDAVMAELGLEKEDHSLAFAVKKEIIRRVEQLKKEDPTSIASLEERIMAYVDRFEALGFRRFNPFDAKGHVKLLLVVGAVIGAPFFALSMVINGLPFIAARAAFMKLLLSKVTKAHKQGEINPAFAGSLAFSTGLVIFLLWYIGLAILSSWVMPWWLGWPVSWVIGYQSGRFALIYVKWLGRLRRLKQWKAFQGENRDEADALLQERSELLKLLMRIYKGQEKVS